MAPPLKTGRKPEYRIYCIMSKEALAAMKGNRGKMVAQGGHAFLHAWWSSLWRNPLAALRYKFSQAAVKITLVIENDDMLEHLYEQYESRRNVGVTKVVDAGRTVFGKPTFTCVGIGPILPDKAGPWLSSLKTLV